MSSDFLQKVIAEKRSEVEQRRKQAPESLLRELASRRSPARRFADALREGQNISIIAEMKKASPSGGMLREDYDVQKIARSYAANGASAFSVLTDEKYFQGNLEHLQAVSRLNLRPVLRKDFIVDSYQILEARAFGADAILLIVAALPKEDLFELKSISDEWGMDSLIEVHFKYELEAALLIGAELIGINNRNLKTLKTSLEVTEHLAPLVPRNRIIVSESGISSKADIVRLSACGIHAVLVGTHLMRHDDPGQALAELVGVHRQ
jgi:indole-3-glycerol phosphate synthase